MEIESLKSRHASFQEEYTTCARLSVGRGVSCLVMLCPRGVACGLLSCDDRVGSFHLADKAKNDALLVRAEEPRRS